MIRKMMIKLAATATIIFSVCAAGVTAHAETTVDDVAETARKYGLPESLIQQGYNEYYADPDTYNSDDFDYAIDYIEKYHQDILDKFNPTTSNPNEESKEQTTTTTGNSGSEDRISESEFINMTLEQKQDYVGSLPQEQQEAFLNSLSPDELKSIVKQLPTDDKVVVMDSFVKAGEAMGVKVTIDELSDDTISMTMRNKNGELIDVASIGVIVEDTGYDHRRLISLSAVLIFAAIGGIWLIVRKCFINKKTEGKNE